MMSKSPPMKIEATDLVRGSSADAQLNYLAALFKGTLLGSPGAYLVVTVAGRQREHYLDVARTKLAERGVPWHKILTVLAQPARTLNPEDRFAIFHIEYRPLRKLSVQLTPESRGSPVEAHFEIAPDGTAVEIGGNLVLAKKFLENRSGRVVKVALKLKGWTQLDLAMQNKVKASLIGKIRAVYDVTVTRGVSVELYLDTFVKHGKSETKFGAGAGAGLTFYW
jgi:hypothetical protein